MPKLADFDASTQAHATSAYQQFLAQYRIPASLIAPDELGAAVAAASEGHGSADSGFKDRFYSALYQTLHRSMSKHAAVGQRWPTGLDNASYDLLRRALEGRFGPLPSSSPAGTTDGGVHHAAPGSMEALLASRANPPSAIDPAVAAALKSNAGTDPSATTTRLARPTGSRPTADEAVYVYRVTEVASGRAVEIGVPHKKLPAGANLYTEGPLGVDLVENLKRRLAEPEYGRIAVVGGSLLPVRELAALSARPGAITVSSGPIRVV